MNVFGLLYVPRTMRAIKGRKNKMSSKQKALKPRVRDLEKAREYWAANKDKINAKRRAKDNMKRAAKVRNKIVNADKIATERKERLREYWRTYYYRNKEKILAAQKAYVQRRRVTNINRHENDASDCFSGGFRVDAIVAARMNAQMRNDAGIATN